MSIKTRADKAINGVIYASTASIVVLGLLHGWEYVQANGLNPFGGGGTADYRVDSKPQIMQASLSRTADNAPYVVAPVQPVATLPTVKPVFVDKPQVKQLTKPATVSRHSKAAAAKPRTKTATVDSKPQQSTKATATKKHTKTTITYKPATVAKKATVSSKAAQQSMQQRLGGMTTAKPRINGMSVITGLDTAKRSVSFAKAKTDSNKGAIPAQNQQLIRDIKSKVAPATKPIERKTQTIAGVLEPKEAAITRAEATNEQQYNDDLFTPAKQSASTNKVAAAKRLAALKIKAAKQAKQAKRLAAIRAAKQARADKRWSEYLADKRAARAWEQHLVAKRKQAEIARDEAAWIAHIEAKRAARKAAKQAQIAHDKAAQKEAAWAQHLAAKKAAKKAANQAKKARKAVRHSKRESAVMPAPKRTTKQQVAVSQPKKRISKKPTHTHSTGIKKPDAVTVCIVSPVTNKEVCI